MGNLKQSHFKMYSIEAESETLLAETYGSSLKKRQYIKPTEQRNLFLLEDERISNVAGIFTRIFLPQGYPDSVSKDYFAYQIWDTAQAFCSTITGTLATQEVLKGVGVGNNTASPLAATITWVVKDGCGHVGKIIFAYSHGSYLDAYSKKWRLYADTLNDAAMCMEICLSLFTNYTRIALCVSTVMKAIVSVAGGATRAALTQHHAIRGNLADVAAKDAAQETAVNLFASFTALFIMSLFGNSMIIFFVMIVFHIIFNYFAVRAVCLRTLNEPRFLQVIDSYLRKEVIVNPCRINKTEPIIFYQLGFNLLDLKMCGFQIKLGHSIEHIVKVSTKASHMREIKKIYKDSPYILFPHTSVRTMYVFIKDGCSPDDVLCAYFNAVLLSIIICAINDKDLDILREKSTQKPFAIICDTLQSSEWSRASGEGKAFCFDATYELLRYVLFIASEEWKAVREGLIQTGWDLSKHLLVLDEWRVCSEKDNTLALPDDVLRKQRSAERQFREEISSKTSRRFAEMARERQTRREEPEPSFIVDPEQSTSRTTGKPKTQEKGKSSKTHHKTRNFAFAKVKKSL